MAAIAWAGPALEDLRQTYLFIARDSRQYADIMVRRIRAAVSRLGNFPKRGRVVPEFPDGPYREILVGPYRVVYRHMEDRDMVLVLAVMHGSRLLPPLLERVMYSGVSADGARSVVVIPAHAGIQAAPRSWIPASAGMTFHLYIHAPGSAFNMHNTL